MFTKFKAGLLAMVVAISGVIWQPVFAQVSYTQTWATTGLNSWASQNGGFLRTTTSICATTGSVRANIYNTNATGNFRSPSLSGNNGGLITMSYQYKIINWSGGGATPNTFGTLKVQYGSSTTGPWTDVAGSQISTDHTPSTSCATKTVTFTPPTGTLYVRFNVVWGAGDYYMYFDEVSISQGAAATCSAPTALTAASVTTTSATVSWTAASPAPSNGYQWEVRTSGAGGSGATGLTASGSVGAGVVSASTGATLSAATSYNLYVRSYCGGSDYSSWAGPYAFTTLCNAVNVPYTQDFSSVTPPAIPVCTSVLQAGSGNLWTTATNPGFGFSSNVLRYVYNLSNAANVWYFTQGINLTSGTSYRISFKYGNNNTGYTEKLKVMYGAAATVVGMTNALFDFPAINQAAVQNAVLDFTPSATGVFYFGFQAYSDADEWNLFLDDIVIDVTPACEPATALAISPQSPTTADLSWTGAGNYIVEYGAVGFAPGTGAAAGAGTIATSSATTPYTITFPTSNTIYDVYIRQVCTGPLYSANTGPVKFIPGDVCANAIDLGSLTSPLSSTTVGAGSNYSLACGTNSAPDLVYSIVVPINAQLTIGQTVNAYDSRNAMFYGGACPGSTQIACYDDPDTQTNTWTNTTGTPQTVYWIQDGYVSGSGTFTLAWSLNLCGGTPSALGTSSLGTTDATIQWTGATPTPGSGYEWEVRTSGAGGSGATGLVASGTTSAATVNASISGLTENTTYYIYVRGDCGSGNYGSWAGPASFTTLCAAASVPFFEGFESGQTSNTAVANCWLQESVTGTGTWKANTSNTTYNRTPRTGSWNATLAYSNQDWLFYPLQLTGGTSYTIDVYARQDGSNTADATMTIAYGTVPAAAAMTLNVLVNQLGLTNGAYQLVQGVFNPPVTGVYYIGIRSTISGNPWYVSIDDISVYETPSCTPPTVSAATNITGTSASLNWSASSSAPANGYDWEVRTGGVGGSGATGLVTSGSVAAGVLTATTGASLTPGTTYQVYVRAHCGTGNYSTWDGPVAFTTAYANPFCSNGGVAIPDGGAPSNCAEIAVEVSGLSGNNLGTNVFFDEVRITIAHTWDSDLDIYLVSPTGTQIELSTDNGGSGLDYGTVPVSCPVTSGYTAFRTGATAITSGSAPFVGTYAPEGLFSAFNGQNPNGTWKLKVCDDAGGDEGDVHFFSLHFATCMAPAISAPTSLTPTSATLTWTAASPAPSSGYEWEVRSSGAGGSGASGLEGSGSVGAGVLTAPTGAILSAATTYSVYVRSNCGSGDFSTWAGPYTFTTPCAAGTVPFFDGFEADQTNGSNVSGCWTQASVTGAGSWTANNTLTSFNRTPRTGSYNAYLAYSNEDWLFYPLQLTGGTSYTAEVFARQDGSTSTDANITLKFGTVPNSAAMTLNVSGANAIGIVNGNYQLVQGTYTPTVSGTYYLGVKGSMNGNPWYISLDDVSVYETPSCLPPTALSVGSITGTSATLSWAASVSLPADGYEWEVRTSGAGGSGATGLVATGTVGAGVLTASTGSVLSANTIYSVYVRSVCTAGSTFSTWASTSFSSVPNDVCATATVLPCGTIDLPGTTVNTVSESVTIGCGMSPYGVWYKFTGDGQITTVSATGLSFDLEMGIASGSCGSGNLANLACRDAAGSTGTETYTFTTVSGTDYYVYIGSYVSGGSGTGNFTISRTCIPAPVPPANDACSNAIALNCASTLNGSTVNAVSESTTGFGCTLSSYGVWYKFTGNGQQSIIECTSAVGYDVEMAIMSGSCGSFTNVACLDDVLDDETETYSFTTVNGTDYYVYISYWSSTGNASNTGAFTISRTCTAPPPVPVNDLCSGAITLSCGTTLNGTTVGTVSETISAGCGMGVNNVWYTFVGNGYPTTIAVTTTNYDVEMGIASGSCGSFTNIACRDNAGSAGTETYTFNTVVGTTYYVFIGDWFTGGTLTGNFTISRTCSGLAVWNGSTSSDWATASNWTPATVPTASNNAYIPTYPAGSHWPIVDETVAITGMTIEPNAQLDVVTGNSVSLSGALINNGIVRVQSGASLVQGSSSALSGTGVFNVLRNGSYVYDFWSSPITSAPMAVLSGPTYAYNPALSTADPSDDEFDPGWVSPGAAMIPGKGYASYGVNQTAFNGTVNNGNISIGVTAHPLPNVSFNLIGNPYPSGVSVSSFLAANSALLATGAVYLWDDPGTSPYSSGNYATRNALGGTAGGGGNTPGPNLGTAQGFKVNVNGNGNIQFNNSMRTAGNTTMLFRQVETQSLWLSVTNTQSLFDQTLVSFVEDGTDGEDWAYDAPKLNSMADLSLYSFLDGAPFAIQGYGPLTPERVVPLGLHSGLTSQIVFTLDQTENMDNDDIILEDRYLGLFTDLKQTNYAVDCSAEGYYDRFFLHFSPASVTGINDANSTNNFHASVYGGYLYLSTQEPVIGTVEMFDMSGRMVWSSNSISLNQNGFRTDVSGLTSGVYSVRLVNGNNTQSVKVAKF